MEDMDFLKGDTCGLGSNDKGPYSGDLQGAHLDGYKGDSQGALGSGGYGPLETGYSGLGTGGRAFPDGGYSPADGGGYKCR
jgi:hypothetical protein